MLSGRSPFYEPGMSMQDLVKKIIHDEIVLGTHLDLGPQETFFIGALLTRDVQARLGTQGGHEAVLAHPWFI